MNKFQQLVSNAKQQIREITLDEFIELEANSYTLIDVRDPNETSCGTIPGAKTLSRGIIESLIEVECPDPEQHLVLYCRSGARSALSALSLKNMGYSNVSSLVGGYMGWESRTNG